MNGPHPYPAYKPSAVPWLADVPEHWQLVPFASVARPKSVVNQQNRELLSIYLDLGVVRFSDIEQKRTNPTSEDLSAYQAVDPGDFVLNNQQAWRGSVGVSQYEGIVSPAYIVLAMSSAFDPRFANLLFRGRAMVAQYLMCSEGVGTIQRNLYWPHLKRTATLLPPLPEQRAIVRYLDHVDRRIRRYVAAKRKLIALLEEEKRAVVNQAVTRGLNPNVRLKPSGVEWLGDVPEHWEIRRLKTICAMNSGEGITAESIEAAGEYPVYGGNGLRGYASSYTHDGAFALIGRQGALCGNVHIARGRFWASEHAVVADLDVDHEIDWFGAILTVMNLNQYSIAAAQPGLAVERIVNLYLPVPPTQEQKNIAKHIGMATADIDTAIARAPPAN